MSKLKEIFADCKINNPNKDFKRYKTDNGVDFPGSAKFTGDKLPKQGDSAQNELKDWKEQDKKSQNFRKTEHATKGGSVILNPKIREENVKSHIEDKDYSANMKNKGTKKSSWKSKMQKLADVNFQQKPDGEVSIDVKGREVEEVPIEELNEEFATESSWKKTLAGIGEPDISFKRIVNNAS